MTHGLEARKVQSFTSAVLLTLALFVYLRIRVQMEHSLVTHSKTGEANLVTQGLFHSRWHVLSISQNIHIWIQTIKQRSILLAGT